MTKPVVVFDLDGTLIHSAPDLHAAANVALSTIGRPTLDLATVISFVGNGVEKLVERCVDTTGGGDGALRAHAFDLFMESYTQNMTTLSKPYPGAMRCLEDLANHGHALGICTNKPTPAARDICVEFGLSDHITVISGAETGQPIKPDPRSLLTTIAELGGDPATAIFVGDSAVDVKTAENAGVRLLFYSKGYARDPRPVLPQDQVFDDWSDVFRMISES